MKVLFKVLGFIFIVATFLFALIGKVGWAIFYALLAVVMFVIKPKPMVKPEPAATKTDTGPEIDFRYLEFPVAGVTFSNEDGKSRQKILKKLCDGEEQGWESADLEECEYKGDPAIRVMTDEGSVGFIRSSDVKTVLRILESRVYSTNIDIETFEDEDEKTIYRCDVNLKVDRQDPGLQWYFDEL